MSSSPHHEGLSLCQEEADKIFKKHGLTEKCKTFEEVPTGWNNKVYLVESTTGENYAIRISAATWSEAKIEAELAAYKYVQKATTISTPKILFWDSSADDFGFRYIVMSRVDGTCLVDVWKDMTFEQKNKILDQMVEILKQLQTQTFNESGGFIQESNTVKIGPYFDFLNTAGVPPGPYNNLKDFLKGYLVSYTRCATTMGLDKLIEYIPKVTNFVDNIEKYVDVNVPLVLFHGDFDLRNIMVNDSHDKITALLDWEWTGVFPAYHEWYNGFDELKESGFKELFIKKADDAGLLTPNTLKDFDKYNTILETLDCLGPWHVMGKDKEAKQKIIQGCVAKIEKNLASFK